MQPGILTPGAREARIKLLSASYGSEQWSGTMTRSTRYFLGVLSLIVCVIALVAPARAGELRIVKLVTCSAQVDARRHLVNPCFTCLDAKVEPGQIVTLLGTQLHRGITGDTLLVPKGDRVTVGTRIHVVGELKEAYHEAVIGDSVTYFHENSLRRIWQQPIIDSLLRLISQNESLKVSLAWRNPKDESYYAPIKVYQTLLPRGIYLVDHPYATIVLSGDKIYPLVPVADGICSKITQRAFTVNGHYYIELWNCGCRSGCQNFVYPELIP